jgi:rifamycin polyketide synthase module 4/5/6
VGGHDADAALAVTSRVLRVLQTWLAAPALEESRLVVRTCGAVPAGGDHMVTDPAAAAVWGLVRSAQAEHPERIVLLDLDPAAETGADTVLDGVLGAALASGEPQLALRGTSFSVPRLVRVAGQLSDASPTFGPDGTVLVSGAGTLGGVVARHLVARHGVRSLVLASRQGLDGEGVAELVDELTGQGAAVYVVACDVSDRAKVAALLDEYQFSGVVHTAGVFDDGVIEALTPEQLARVFAPKVDAVRHLDELTRGSALDAFVVFSSVAGVAGGGGQGPYAAANAFVDAAMADRRAAGLPGLSLAWGMWERSGGMAARLSAVDHARASRGGVLEMTWAEGLDMFDVALRADESLLVPIKLDLAALRADVAAGGSLPPVFRGLVKARRQQARAAAATESNALPRRLAGLAVDEQEALVLDLVRGQVAAVLGHADPDAVRADTAFQDTGFDSLTSVELRNRLREQTGLKLPATLVFDYPTPLVLARYLRAELVPDGGAGAGATGVDLDEEQLRHALASVPLARLREAGLIDTLTKLAALGDPEQAGGVVDMVEAAAEERSIAELDVDDLVQMALGEDPASGI